MRGLSYRPGKSWPRNPVQPDPALVRERTRAGDRPISSGGLGL